MMDNQAEPAPKRGQEKTRLRVLQNNFLNRKSDRNTVPTRIVHAILRESIKPELPLYTIRDDHVFPLNEKDRQKCLDTYENQWSALEIDLLFAAIQRAGNQKVAIFKTRAEWIELASGRSYRSANDYIQAVDTLAEPHWILDKQDDRQIVVCQAPVELSNEYVLGGPGGTRKVLKVTISKALQAPGRSFYQIPAALGSRLRGGGLPRVKAAHLRLYLYIMTRLKSKRPQLVVTFENVIRAAGLQHHLAPEARQPQRALKKIEQGLNAMVGAGMIISWQINGANKIEILPDRNHFRMAWGEKKQPLAAPEQSLVAAGASA